MIAHAAEKEHGAAARVVFRRGKQARRVNEVVCDLNHARRCFSLLETVIQEESFSALGCIASE
jgi:hypothetical protein